VTSLTRAWQRLCCALNRHDYESLGRHHSDEILRCRVCGQRHTRMHTLRIDRLG